MSRLAVARSVLAAAHQRTGIETSYTPNPLPPPLRTLIPATQIRGRILQISCLTLLWHTVAALMENRQWAIAIGMHDVGWLAAHESGIDFERLLIVSKAPTAPVLAAAIDGARIVVAGPATRLTASDQRALAGRLRQRGASLISAHPWPGAYQVQATTAAARGCDDAAGYLKSRILRATSPAATITLRADANGLETHHPARGAAQLRLVSNRENA